MTIQNWKEPREKWADISRQWYLHLSDRKPTTGRFYHHMAVLALPNALQTIFLCAKALCVSIPFAFTMVMPFFDKHLTQQPSSLAKAEDFFVLCHCIIFTMKGWNILETSEEDFLKLLDNRIGCLAERWRDIGLVAFHVLSSSLANEFGIRDATLPLPIAAA